MRRRRRAALAGVAALALALVAWLGVERWVATAELPPLALETSVEVLARDGSLLRAFTVADGRWRLAVAPDRVDAGYLAMLIAYEDQRFFDHGGVDPLALARASWQALRHGRVVSGGSTLTMQVARLLEDGSTGAWRGKLRQVRLALALERALSKHEILALYLHHAPMGGNLEGVRAGSLAWFGKEPERLTEAETALLVALPQAPALRSPDLHPEAARAARDRVLARAEAAGVIDADAVRAARLEPLPNARRAFPSLAPHLADRLRAADPDRRVHHTTLDASLQSTFEALAADALLGLPPQATLALLVADADSGAILASVGSADYASHARRGFVDMTQALRSPGSTLKPLVYGLAFSDALAHPETMMVDRPASYAGYAPRNFDHAFRGPVSAREALQASLNLPVVELTHALGPARLMAALRQVGVEAAVPGDAPGLAVSLGGVGVSLEGLVQLYAAIARGGEAVALSAVDATPAPRARLMTPAAAWHLGDILAAAPRPGRLPDWPLAFKTGTSHGHRDALALGFDGKHVVGVWAGRADGAPVPGMYGVEVAAPVLFEVFARLGDGPVALPPAPPGTLQATNARLPPPLRQFGARLVDADEAPRVAFPPDGASLVPLTGGVVARVERGLAPFTWFANDAPVLLGSFEREARLSLDGPGFVTLAVVDAEGRAARVRIELR
ncbi:MAG: penicillin-binding protein 1C [Trueperaceae bacterium]|nr:MAG: penicillin-binding protein 1C [Trueperaceae bacterium]